MSFLVVATVAVDLLLLRKKRTFLLAGFLESLLNVQEKTNSLFDWYPSAGSVSDLMKELGLGFSSRLMQNGFYLIDYLL